MISKAVISSVLIVMGSAATALDLADCDRTTHVSHAGETAHQDLGDGRVQWQTWWSQEGSMTRITVADCAPGQALTAVTAEENMRDALPFDKTTRVERIIERHETGARTFSTLPRIAADLDGIARDVRIETLAIEPCACAALYPDLRGAKTEFVLGG